jgi:hypothetical protein
MEVKEQVSKIKTCNTNTESRTAGGLTTKQQASKKASQQRTQPSKQQRTVAAHVCHSMSWLVRFIQHDVMVWLGSLLSLYSANV